MEEVCAVCLRDGSRSNKWQGGGKAREPEKGRGGGKERKEGEEGWGGGGGTAASVAR